MATQKRSKLRDYQQAAIDNIKPPFISEVPAGIGKGSSADEPPFYSPEWKLSEGAPGCPWCATHEFFGNENEPRAAVGKWFICKVCIDIALAEDPPRRTYRWAPRKCVGCGYAGHTYGSAAHRIQGTDVPIGVCLECLTAAGAEVERARLLKAAAEWNEYKKRLNQ